MPSTTMHHIAMDLALKERGIKRPVRDESARALKYHACFVGSVAPDWYPDKFKSHFKIPGTYPSYWVPDLKQDWDNKSFLPHPCNPEWKSGWRGHMLMDYLLLEKHLPALSNFSKLTNFDDIYQDYKILQPELIKYFGLDLDYIKFLAGLDFPVPLYDFCEGQTITENSTGQLNQYSGRYESVFEEPPDGKLKFLSFEPVIDFLKESAHVIAKNIK